MSTLRQIEANRRNAQKSTGPRSVEGKAITRMNALQSGIDAESNIVRGENAADLQTLTDTYYRECRPATALEQFYVDVLIRNDWQLRRLERAEAQIWERQIQNEFREVPGCELGSAYLSLSATFIRLQRRKNDIQRNSIQASRELRKLQADRPAPEVIEAATPFPQIGFVPDNNVGQAPSPAPDPLVRPPAVLTTRAFPFGFVPQSSTARPARHPVV